MYHNFSLNCAQKQDYMKKFAHEELYPTLDLKLILTSMLAIISPLGKLTRIGATVVSPLSKMELTCHML